MVAPSDREHAGSEQENVREKLTRALLENAEQIASLEQSHARLVEASESSNADDEHDPEGATIAYERQQLDSMLVRARLTRVDLHAAIDGLEKGTYGTCERCGRPISPARLEARPQAKTCISCARSA